MGFSIDLSDELLSDCIIPRRTSEGPVSRLLVTDGEEVREETDDELRRRILESINHRFSAEEMSQSITLGIKPYHEGPDGPSDEGA